MAKKEKKSKAKKPVKKAKVVKQQKEMAAKPQKKPEAVPIPEQKPPEENEPVEKIPQRPPAKPAKPEEKPKARDTVAREMEEETKLEELVIRLDKLEGKTEMFEQFKEATFDRVSQLSEGIGDLRRMILDREKLITEMQVSTEKMQEIVKDFDPKTIKKQAEKNKLEMQTIEAKMEKGQESARVMNDKISELQKILSNIRNIENFVKETKKIGEKIDVINNAKRDIDRIGSKVETMFSDINEKMIRMKSLTNTIQKADDLSSELVKEFDRFKVMFDENAIKRNDLDQFKTDIEEKIKEFVSQPVSPELSKRLDYIEKMFKEIKQRHVTSEDVMQVKRDLTELRRSKRSIKQLEKEKMTLEDVMQTAETDFSDGLISKKAYDEIMRKGRMRIDEIGVIMTRTDNEMFGEKVRNIENEVTGMMERMKRFETKDSLKDAREKFAVLEERLKHIGNLFTRVSEMEDEIQKERKSKEKLSIVLKETRDSIHSFVNDVVEIRKKLTEQEAKHTDKINEKMERLEKMFRKTAEGMAGRQEMKNFEGRMSELIEKNTKIMEVLMEGQLPKRGKKPAVVE
ncbi:MAG: hypothetical protein JW754_00690 [Candidatus Aenigmarchaeota archaeon]|nr:hypothetical protein [Candidatus Aenigmarchaeota archaeon]